MIDDETLRAMECYGGNFVWLLAQLYRAADEDNRARILASWPEYIKKYREIVGDIKEDVK